MDAYGRQNNDFQPGAEQNNDSDLQNYSNDNQIPTTDLFHDDFDATSDFFGDLSLNPFTDTNASQQNDFISTDHAASSTPSDIYNQFNFQPAQPTDAHSMANTQESSSAGAAVPNTESQMAVDNEQLLSSFLATFNSQYSPSPQDLYTSPPLGVSLNADSHSNDISHPEPALPIHYCTTRIFGHSNDSIPVISPLPTNVPRISGQSSRYLPQRNRHISSSSTGCASSSSSSYLGIPPSPATSANENYAQRMSSLSPRPHLGYNNPAPDSILQTISPRHNESSAPPQGPFEYRFSMNPQRGFTSDYQYRSSSSMSPVGNPSPYTAASSLSYIPSDPNSYSYDFSPHEPTLPIHDRNTRISGHSNGTIPVIPPVPTNVPQISGRHSRTISRSSISPNGSSMNMHLQNTGYLPQHDRHTPSSSTGCASSASSSHPEMPSPATSPNNENYARSMSSPETRYNPSINSPHPHLAAHNYPAPDSILPTTSQQNLYRNTSAPPQFPSEFRFPMNPQRDVTSNYPYRSSSALSSMHDSSPGTAYTAAASANEEQGSGISLTACSSGNGKRKRGNSTDPAEGRKVFPFAYESDGRSDPKSKLAGLACKNCRKHKTKCPKPLVGSRDPTCISCKQKGLKCEYPTENGRGKYPRLDRHRKI